MNTLMKIFASIVFLFLIGSGVVSVRARNAAIQTSDLAAEPVGQCKRDTSIENFIADIEKARRSVLTYKPSSGKYIVPFPEFLFFAFSAIEREKRSKDWNEYRANKNCNKLDPALDALAAAARTKMQSYRPSASIFRFKDPDAVLVMDGFTEGRPSRTVHNVGFETAQWLIRKNGLGEPLYKYKWANLYFRDSSDDHPYCHLYRAEIRRDVEDDGTVSSEMYTNIYSDELYACPIMPSQGDRSTGNK